MDPGVIASNFQNDGQSKYDSRSVQYVDAGLMPIYSPDPGQVPSLTSSNNFINFCVNSTKPLTNGQQVKDGSCNPAPMGILPSLDHMPSAKFKFPTNHVELEVNTTFTISLALSHIDTGFFVNTDANYFSAPQVVGPEGDIQGHSHVVIEKLTSLTQTTPTDPKTFVFFKGLNAKGNVLEAEVTNGLDEGVYRIASINSAANHQPVLVPVAQHGTVDDMVYVSLHLSQLNSYSTSIL